MRVRQTTLPRRRRRRKGRGDKLHYQKENDEERRGEKLHSKRRRG